MEDYETMKNKNDIWQFHATFEGTEDEMEAMVKVLKLQDLCIKITPIMDFSDNYDEEFKLKKED